MIHTIRREKKRQIRLYIGVFLFFLILGISIYYGVTVSNAASVTVGTVNTSSGSLNIRSGPGTSYASIGSLSKGTQVTITGEKNGWYKVQYGSSEGYVSKDYITNVHTVEQDNGYIDTLTAQGFPESYAVLLSQLHSQYPNWVFEPVMTGLDWNTVIKEESHLGKNLVQASNNDAQKSTAAGAYDWATNSWIGYDGASWVCASPEMVQYCMDPRNFLDADNIFQFATNDYKDYQNASGVSALLNGTFMSGNYKDTDGETRSYPDTFVSVGSTVGVSPYHLASRCRQEQGVKGTSDSISGTVSGYKGYFNYFNINAYPSGGLTSVQNGLKYAKQQGWNTRYASILGGAKIVGNNYVKKGQNTVYFEKFNVVNTVSGLYGHQYMTNVQAAISEGKNIKKGYTDNGAAIVFRIPVYNNMPEAASALPSGGNPNNWIQSLKVSGYSLTPGFSPSKTEYSLIVESNVASVKISGTPVASTSKISGTGTVSLDYGRNTVTVNCTAQNGTVRAYTLDIVRNKPANAGNNTAISKGDVNGDGVIALADLVAVKRHILEFETLRGDKFTAADVDGDGSISLTDYVKIKRHILGYETIK